MSPRAMIFIALFVAVVALAVFFMDVPRWLPPRVQPLLPDAGHHVVVRPPPHQPAPGCSRHAKKICDGGDVWWLDSCGQLEELDENCDDALCREGKCLPPAPGPPCETLSEGGVCDGNVLRYCEHGRARSVDCGEKKCALDAEGEPNCIKPPAKCRDACDGPIAETCNESGRHLVLCEGKCELADGHARCVKPARCDGCSCPSPSPEPLPPIEIVAYLVSDDDDRTVESEERARAAVEEAAQWFAVPNHDTGLRFTLREVRTLKRPRWIAATHSDVHEAEMDPELHRGPYAVPVVFVREIQLGEKKTPGVGTFPNGACADMPVFSYHPSEGGVIFLGRLRYGTTLAHELGHYFGLCHTHQPDSHIAQLAVKSDGTTIDCASCGLTGDGVCDTPVDPGVEGCTLDPETCVATCKSGATPDTNNLMSYFVPCRRWFSDEQAGYLRRWARWRIEHARLN